MAKTKRSGAKAPTYADRAMRLAAKLQKDSPENARLVLAVREGLLAPEKVRGRGGALAGAVHSMNLVRVTLDSQNGIAGTPEPENVLVHLAFAYDRIRRVIEAVEHEVELAEQDNLRRAGRAA